MWALWWCISLYFNVEELQDSHFSMDNKQKEFYKGILNFEEEFPIGLDIEFAKSLMVEVFLQFS